MARPHVRVGPVHSAVAPRSSTVQATAGATIGNGGDGQHGGRDTRWRRQLWKWRPGGNHKPVPTGTWKSRTEREIPTFPLLIIVSSTKKKTGPELQQSVTHVSGLFCYRCFRLRNLLLVAAPRERGRNRCKAGGPAPRSARRRESPAHAGLTVASGPWQRAALTSAGAPSATPAASSRPRPRRRGRRRSDHRRRSSRAAAPGVRRRRRESRARSRPGS